ncbi:acetyl/propionyl-CoA carboxylase, alpha subunit [Corynebacterium uterequi]|uniref:biotin carboxylase n=1 Tax=Corynebacterium uterequi TaxID=1072256 RepID=A0A0G3HHI2_9CORY|nr:acetyl/propionyl-CoA carboxylase, alpha subunit [Corynebacterium uterequi]
MKTLLIANRGEIAERIIRTARELGITTVVGYSDGDRDAGFVALADHAYALGGTHAGETYLNVAKLLDLARRSGADAVHPGYGFLSESADFAAAVIDAGLTWVGPDPTVLAGTGDKIAARHLADRVGVATVPGVSEPVRDATDLRHFAADHGFPILAKQADGGGGRGIVALRTPGDIDRFVRHPQFPTRSYFVEKLIGNARHIEVQCARDAAGHFAAVSTRDCSLQRRNQKLIEEAPATGLKEEATAYLTDAAHALCEGVGLVGLCTCEFLVEPGATGEDGIYFLEINPRLQVEHPVTEEVAGVDLVAWQIAIARGQDLPERPAPRGHSLEFRITCEDPTQEMKPTGGTIERLRWPVGPGVRIDSGVTAGDAVSADFDPMIAKIIVTGPTRERAVARARRVLSEFELVGIPTPVPLYQSILATDAFASQRYSTRWLEEGFLPNWPGVAGTTRARGNEDETAPQPGHWREIVVEIDGKRTVVGLPSELLPGATSTTPEPLRRAAQRIRRAARRVHRPKDAAPVTGEVRSPIQAIVSGIATNVGAEVDEGELLLTLEAMKMETYVCAPCAGTVESIAVTAGDSINAEDLLVTIHAASAATPTEES